jgi:hypothetical protein
MNNSYIMSESLEARQKRTRAAMITAGFAALMIVLMIIIKWDIPKIEKEFTPVEVEIALNLPEPPDPPEQALGGGGGGGNPVSNPEPAGQAPPTPPTTGEKDESDDAEVSENNNTPIPKAVKPKPDVKEIVKTGPVKPVEKPAEIPVPPKPKIPLYKGATDHGNATGGGADIAKGYEKGGSGNGSGVGRGDGTGGGSGNGNGGGNGTGVGTGTGPKRISGSRTVISPKPMNVEDDLKGKIVAEIKVSPDGVGTFIRAKGGSLMSSAAAKEVVRDWLRRNKFNKVGDETIEVYEFNINY